MKFIAKSIAFLVLVVALLLFSRNMVVKAAVTKGVKAATGLKLVVNYLDLGMGKAIVDIKGIQLYNPPGYQDKVMMDVPEIYVNYDFGALLKKQVHLREVRLDLKEFIIVKNTDGSYNIDALKIDRGPKKKAEPAPKKKGGAPGITIDQLNLRIGRVVYKDYSAGGEPVIQEFNVNMDQQYNNITDIRVLGSLIVTQAVTRTAISRLTDLDIGAFQQDADQLLRQATNKVTGELGDTLDKAAGVLQGLFGE